MRSGLSDLDHGFGVSEIFPVVTLLRGNSVTIARKEALGEQVVFGALVIRKVNDSDHGCEYQKSLHVNGRLIREDQSLVFTALAPQHGNGLLTVLLIRSVEIDSARNVCKVVTVKTCLGDRLWTALTPFRFKLVCTVESLDIERIDDSRAKERSALLSSG